MYRADSFFTIGRTHTVCQDYAKAGNCGSVVALSDGCSGSPETDVGARLLVQGALSAQEWVKDLTWAPKSALRTATQAVSMVGFHPMCLDATLLMAAGYDDAVRVRVFGDGVVAARHRDTGDIHSYSIEFAGEAPLYLSYGDSPMRAKQYAGQGFGERSVNVTCAGNSLNLRLVDHVSPEPFPESYDVVFPVKDHDLVVLLSDGVRTFTDREGRLVPLEEVLSEVFAIKNPVGQFLTRRCHRFLEKRRTADGWTHADDFSAAAIYCEGVES